MSLPSGPAARIAFLYLAIALPWVMGTDLLISWLALNPDVEATIARFKGASFVIVTAIALMVGLQRWTQSLTNARLVAEESEARLASFLATIDDFILITDLDQRIVEVIGPVTTHEDRLRFVGHRAPELFGADVGEAFLELGRRAIAGKAIELDWSGDEYPVAFPIAPRRGRRGDGDGGHRS